MEVLANVDRTVAHEDTPPHEEAIVEDRIMLVARIQNKNATRFFPRNRLRVAIQFFF